MERLIAANKEQSFFEKQCQYLRCLLLEKFGGAGSLEGGFLLPYVLDMERGNRRLCKRNDLTELYRLLLCENRDIATTIKSLLLQPEVTVSSLSLELVEHCHSITEVNIVQACAYHTPQMQLYELAYQCWVELNYFIELIGVWRTVKSDTVA